MYLRALGITFLIALPSVSHAQVDLGDIGGQIGKALGDAMTKMRIRKMLVTPALILVDAKSNTATIEFSNPTDDTIEAAISAGTRSPKALARKSSVRKNGSSGGAGLLAEGETSASADSISPDSSLVDWIKNLPAKLKLVPGEKKSVTVRLDIPADVKPGEYSAWIVTTTSVGTTKKPATSGDGSAKVGENAGSGLTVVAVSSQDGSPALARAGARMVLRIEAKH